MSSIPFDQSSVIRTEFFVAFPGDQDALYNVPVMPRVTAELQKMLRKTLENLGSADNWNAFECSEQYKSIEQLTIDITDPIASKVAQLYSATNLPSAANALADNPSGIDYYFAKFWDNQGKYCVAVRKASQFKSALNKPLMYVVNGQLDIIQDKIFRLNDDFDFIIFEDRIAIYRPTQFERIAEVDTAFQEMIPSLIQSVSSRATNIDFTFADDLTKKSSKARRLIAAISKRDDIIGLDHQLFGKSCQNCKIPVTENNGKWMPNSGYELDLLEMLDRRRFADPLVEDQPENYRAAARTKL